MSDRSGAQVESGPFRVRSGDGTPLAVWEDGRGPALVLVHGGVNDHTADGDLVRELRHHFTTFAFDRRGRGASGDAVAAYAIEREFEDVAVVVDAVAARTGSPVGVWGHSYGADCAMGAATLTRHVHRLVLYEPGLGMTYPDGAVEAVDALVAAGDLEGALVAVLVQIVELTDEELAFIRASPVWPNRVAAVPTVTRELRAESGWSYRPGCFDAVSAPTLVLAGTASPPAQQEATARAASAIPGARVARLEGHGHIAHRTDPPFVASIVRDFVAS